MEDPTRVCRRSTRLKVHKKKTADCRLETADDRKQKTEDRRQTADCRLQTADRGSKVFLSFVSSLQSLVCSLFLVVSSLSLSGCGPKYTYPSDSVSSSIEKVSRDEYKLDVTSSVAGKTLGAVHYVDDILDDKGQIPKEIHEKIGQIMQVITRVGLSTDRIIDFCVVIIRDRAHLNELVITRSLDDSKRANSDAIGVEESINRTLFGQEKYQPELDGEKVFALKEVKFEDFLAEQIAQRVRFSIAREAKESSGEEETDQQALVLVDGVFNRADDGNEFRFSVLSLKSEGPQESIRQVLRTASDVLGGYKFEGFSSIEILDYLNRQKLEIKKEVLLDLQAKKISEQAVLDRYLTESQTIQEAFKLFGFNLSESVDATDSPPLAPAAP